MSTFKQAIEVGDLQGQRFVSVDALVEPGATYTTVPRELLAELGVGESEQRRFVLANGERVLYGVGWARIRLDGREQPTPVIFGNPGSTPLLGAVTLEEFGLGVDSLNRRLIETPGYLVGVRLDDGQ